MICKNCKKEVPDDSKFCKFCGSKLNKGYAHIIEQILKEKPLTTLEQLNKKMWYRALKTLYFIGVIIGLIFSLGVSIDEAEPVAFLILGVLTFLILEIFKRSFFYIYLGKIFPSKKIC